LHGAVVTDKVNIAQHADLKIGVVPVINLDGIQKLHRDRRIRLHQEAVTNILRRMPDYVNYICRSLRDRHHFPARANGRHLNPSSRAGSRRRMNRVVIRLKNPRRHDFPYLLSMIPNSFSRAPIRS